MKFYLFIGSFSFLLYIFFDNFYSLKKIVKDENKEFEIYYGVYSSAFNSLNDETKNSLPVKKEIIDLTFKKFINVNAVNFSNFFENLNNKNFNNEFIAEAFILKDEITILINEESKFHSLKKISVDDFIFSLLLKKDCNEENKFFFKNILDIKKINSKKVILKINLKKVSPFCFLNFLSKLRIYNSSEFNSNFDFFSSGMKILDGSGSLKIISAKKNSFLKLKKVIDEKHNFDFFNYDFNYDFGKFINNFLKGKNKIINIKYFRNQLLQISELFLGKIDFIIFNSPEEWFNKSSLINIDENNFLKIKKKSGKVYTKFIKFNLEHEILKDKNFRKAIAIVFDYDSCNKMFYGNEMIYSPFFFDDLDFDNKNCSEKINDYKKLNYENSLNNNYEKNEKKIRKKKFYNHIYDFSLQFDERIILANKILDNAGFILKKNKRFYNGKKIELKIITADPKIKKVINLYRDSLKKIGIELIILQLDSTMFQNKLRNGDFDMVIKNYHYSSNFINSFEIRNLLGIRKNQFNDYELNLINNLNTINSQKDFFELMRIINLKLSHDFLGVVIFKDRESRIVFNKKNFINKKALQNLKTDLIL